MTGITIFNVDREMISNVQNNCFPNTHELVFVLNSDHDKIHEAEVELRKILQEAQLGILCLFLLTRVIFPVPWVISLKSLNLALSVDENGKFRAHVPPVENESLRDLTGSEISSSKNKPRWK